MKCVSQRRFCFLLQRYEKVIFIWGKKRFCRSNNCFITPFSQQIPLFVMALTAF